MTIESVQLLFQWTDTLPYVRDLRVIKRVAFKVHCVVHRA